MKIKLKLKEYEPIPKPGQFNSENIDGLMYTIIGDRHNTQYHTIRSNGQLYLGYNTESGEILYHTFTLEDMFLRELNEGKTYNVLCYNHDTSKILK